MKRFIAILALVLLFPALSFAAAGTLTGSTSIFTGISGKREIMVNTYVVTFGAAHEEPYAVPLDIISDSSGNALISVAGWWLFRVDTLFGGTAPTADTDLQLWSVRKKIDILGGNGVDGIDATTNNRIYPAVSTQPLTGNEELDIDNNAVNSATTTIIFTMYR